MKTNLTLWLEDNSISDPQMKWEWIKYKVRNETMKYVKKKCIYRKDRMKNLTDRLNSLDKSLANNPSDDILNEIVLIKNELEELDSKIVDGIIVRSRIRWAEKGEKSNKYFLSLEKRICRKKQCKKLILDDGTEIVKPDLILNMQSDYYKHLYESKVETNTSNHDPFLYGESIPSLDEADALKCEG